VDVSAASTFQKTFQDRARDRSGIELVHFAAVINSQLVHASRRNLREKAAELLAESQMRTDDRQCFRVEVRHVDRVANCSFEARGPDIVLDFNSRPFLALGGMSAKLRRQK